MAKILVVEDEVIVAWDIKETLEKLGHAVVNLVVSGAEALGSAFTDRPDLVLMDIRLEGEMDGITAGNEIYDRLNIPVVYLTAHADELTLARATKTNPFGYIIKPFQSQSLQSTIKVALQRHQVEESVHLTQACLIDTLNSRNQDLEFFQLRLISQLQSKTAEYQQTISCIQLLNLVLNKVYTVGSEEEILQIAIEQIGTAIDADYCWITRHDAQGATSRIVCEYINPDRQLYPTSKIGKEIDLLLYPQFYNHLLEIGNWIDPPLDILPKPYLDLLTIAAQMLIAPMIVDLQSAEYPSASQNERTIGEVGIITTGKADWTSLQSDLITQILSYIIKLFHQTHGKSCDSRVGEVRTVALGDDELVSPQQHPKSIDLSLSLEWLNSLKDNFSDSISNVNRDMQISAEMLQKQIHSFNVEIENSAVVRHHQFLHHELAVNLETLQTEWRRQFELIDTLIDLQTNGTTFQIQSLNDILFRKWIAAIVENCTDLAERYHLDFSYQMTENIPQILLCPFSILESIVIEMFNNACKYTPPYYPIILEIDIRDRQLHINVVSFEIEISVQELATMFIPFSPSLSDIPQQHGSTGLGLALVKKLSLHLGGKIQAQSDRHSTRLLLSVPMLGKDNPN
jgi:CheY-like chemotaxis protein